jgi:EAL domain-containing protein (putative c-di-GMP-specific phosphodiesterase class I)
METEKQYQILQDLLCNEVQGHHVSRAPPPDAFEILVRGLGWTAWSPRPERHP